jgi:hypothetical protein
MGCYSFMSNQGRMMRLKFIEVDGKLGIEKNGQKVYVYRCLLHESNDLGRQAIPTYLSLLDTRGTRKALFAFQPILELANVDISALPNEFDEADRGDIDPKEKGAMHIRFKTWQLYEFIGEDNGKDCSLPGIWDLIPLDLESRPETAIPEKRPPPAFGP